MGLAEAVKLGFEQVGVRIKALTDRFKSIDGVTSDKQFLTLVEGNNLLFSLPDANYTPGTVYEIEWSVSNVCAAAAPTGATAPAVLFYMGKGSHTWASSMTQALGWSQTRVVAGKTTVTIRQGTNVSLNSIYNTQTSSQIAPTTPTFAAASSLSVKPADASGNIEFWVNVTRATSAHRIILHNFVVKKYTIPN